MPGQRACFLLRSRRRHHGHATWPGRQLRPAIGPADPPLRQPDALGLCHGQLARHAAADPAVGSPLRRPAACLGAPELHGQLRARELSVFRVALLELRRLDDVDRTRLPDLHRQQRHRTGLHERRPGCRDQRLPAWTGSQRLQNLPASHWLLRGSVRQRQDRSPRRLRHLLRAHAGQRRIQRRDLPAVLVRPLGDPGIPFQPAHQQPDWPHRQHAVLPGRRPGYRDPLSCSCRGPVQPGRAA